MPAPIDGTKTPFQLSMDKQSNLIPRMNPSIKHELYFPQCYAPPFGQSFNAQQLTHNTSSNNNSTVGNSGNSSTATTSTIQPPAVAQWSFCNEILRFSAKPSDSGETFSWKLQTCFNNKNYILIWMNVGIDICRS